MEKGWLPLLPTTISKYEKYEMALRQGWHFNPWDAWAVPPGVGRPMMGRPMMGRPIGKKKNMLGGL